PVPGLHRALLRAAHVREASAARRPLLPALHPVDRRAHDNALGRLRAARRLRRLADGLDALHVGDRRQDAADALHDHAARLRVRDRALPGRARPLLGDDEPVDGGPGAHHAPPHPEDDRAGCGEADLADAAARRRRRWQRSGAEAGRAEAGRAARAAAAAEGAAEEEGRPPVSSEVGDLTVEATGETVGEAKWAALRELEQRHPALDKAAVRFEVVSEGERGLLGVGYAPARVVAHLPSEAVDAVELDESEL